MDQSLGHNEAYQLTHFTVAEFKRFRKSLSILTQSGICRDEAACILIRAWGVHRENFERMQSESRREIASVKR